MSRTPETLPREMVLLSEKSGEGTSETLPRMMVFVSDKLGNGCVKYKSETEIIWDNDGSVFDPEAKIVAERAKIDDNLLNLRCGYSNRYWACDELGYLVANSKTPDEDKSKPSCTLFAIASLSAYGYPGYYSIQHIQTGNYIVINRSFSDRLYVLDGYTTLWQYMDWESLVRIPDHVAFKRNNGKYLKAIWQEEHPYHQFSSTDPNDGDSGYRITHLPSGYLMIKSDHFDKFWRRSPNWIWADYAGDSTNDTMFWPVKIDDNTVALKSPANDHFLSPVTMDGKTDCLNAAHPTITDTARFVVEELVLNRKVYNVKYLMDEARVYDEKPYVAGTATATNDGDEEAYISVEVEYVDQRSYSFTRGLSIAAGANMSIEADLLGIVEAKIEFSFSVSGAFEWNDTTTTTTSLKATGSVPVPARSKGVVHYVGTKGSCDVPFHYTQRSSRSTDGKAVITDEIDGIYKGVNCYNFDFRIEKTEPL